VREPPRALRLLLRLYPAAHRRDYGAEMWEVIRHRYGTARGGRLRRLLLHVEVALDLAGTALPMWTTTTMRRRATMGPSGGWRIDIRFVLRSLRRNPGYALTAMVVLAGAVAVNAAVFGYVRGTLLAPATYPDADRVVILWGSNPGEGQLRDVISGPNYIDFRAETTSLEAMAAFHADDVLLTGDGPPEVLDAYSVSVDFFDVVPVRPMLGRVFDERERNSGGEVAVVVSFPFWRDRLGADPSWVGRSIQIDYAPVTVIGVLPEGYEFVTQVPFYLALHDDELAARHRSNIHFHIMGRLRDGVTAADVTRDFTAALRRVTERTGMYRTWTMLAEPLHDASVLAVRPILWTVSAAVGIVLVIALVNLATLFRIRTLGRSDELGVRLALGAGGARVARVLALEAGGIALAGSLLGLLLAAPLLARMRDMLPLWIAIPDSAARVPILRAELDPAVALVTVGLSLLGAFALTTPGLVAAVRDRGAAWGGRRRSGARGTRWLVAAELALATVLCLGAGLTTRSADKLLGTDVGLRDEGLLTLYFGDVWERPYEEQAAYLREVVDAVQALPGVTSAALIDYVPFQGEDDFQGIDFFDGRSLEPTRHVREEWRRVGAGLIETAGMRIVAGRSLEALDFEGEPEAVLVNETFARKHFPDGDVVGRFIRITNEHYGTVEIVGVFADVRERGPANPAPPVLYVPLQGEPRGTTGMYVRVASGPPMALADAVRGAVSAVDPLQPVDAFFPMTELVSAWVAIPRAVRTLVSGLAALALVLAGIGVFGVVAYAVRTRTAELGVRLALGASPERLRTEAVVTAAPMVVLGVGGGLAAGWLAARGASAALYGVEPLDPPSLAVAVLVMVGAAMVATYLPARRISRIDPTAAIRSE
jgi:predicted permease